MNQSLFKLPTTNSCYFCESLANTSLDLIAETEDLFIQVNSRQFQEGQVLVVSKRHAPTLFDLTETETKQILSAAQRVGRAIAKAFEIDGILIYQNNGVASGQEVPHFHLHVVPQRAENSRWASAPPHVADAQGNEFEPSEPTWLTDIQCNDIAKKLKAHL